MAARPAAARSSQSKQAAPSPQQAATRAKNRLYHKNNREKSLARMKRRYDSLSPAEKLMRNWRESARPSVPRAGTKRALDPRKVSLGRAYCDWSDAEEVVRLYIAAAVMSELTGVKYVVDHAVPLSHPLVCGLHTHTNLQVITLTDNQNKGNWVWPEMWAITWESLAILQKSS